jgi:hypothetical protein
MTAQTKSSPRRKACLLGLLLLAAAPAWGQEFALDASITRDGAVARKSENSGALKRFAESYKSHNKPKIAIFLNRTLSDDVREWKTNGRAVLAGNGSVTTSVESPLHYREETVKGPLAVYGQTENGVGGARNNTDEPYLWEFESGFMQPFLSAGANLVDRATILRLVSKGSDQGIAAEAIETKKNEMNALLNYADIYIELLITRQPSAATGYEFKAVAKEIKTGRIVGMATSLNWDNAGERPKKVIATDKGYQIIDDPKMPRVKNVSNDMALDLMSSLATAWSAN